MITLQIRGMVEMIAGLDKQTRSFAGDVGVETVQRVTLLARRELQKGMSGVTTDRGFWGRGTPYGSEVGVRSGSLRRSITPGNVYRAGNTVIGTVGTNDKRMDALETGKTITPQSGTYLRVPTKYAQTPSGVDVNAGRSMRDVPGTRVHRSKAGNLFIWGDVDATLGGYASGGVVPGMTRTTARGAKRAGRREVPLYMLVTSSKMPEKRTFATTQAVMQLQIPMVADGRVTTWLSQVGSAPGSSLPS